MSPIKEHTNHTCRFVFLLSAFTLLISGFINLYLVYHTPDDQCTWIDTPDGVRVTSVQKNGATDKAGIKPGDFILWISGEPIVTSRRAQQVLESQKIEDIVTYLIFREGKIIPIKVQVVQKGFHPSNIIMSIIGFLFWLVGLWIIWLKPMDSKARILFGLFISFTVFWMFNIVSPLSRWFSIAGLTLRLIAFTAIPSFFLTFFLYYPTIHPIMQKKKIVLPLLFAPTLLLLIWLILTFFLDYPSPINWPVGLGLWGIASTLGLFRLWRVYRSKNDTQLRQQIRVLCWGITVGLIPVFLILIQDLVNLDLGITHYFIPLMGVIPLVFAYTVVKHRLMDIEIFTKKSAVYTVLTGLIAGFYFVIIQIAGSFIQNLGDFTEKIIFIFATFIVAFLFAPLREKIQHLVDRAFFREAYDYRETLKRFSRALNTLIDPEILIDNVLAKICSTMQIEKGSFFLLWRR